MMLSLLVAAGLSFSVQVIGDPQTPSPNAAAESEVETSTSEDEAEERNARPVLRCENRAATGSLVRQRVCRTEQRARDDRDEAGALVDEWRRGGAAMPAND